jgi:hypothetical protein
VSVVIRKEWLRTGAGRLGRERSAVDWGVIWRYGWILAIGFATVLFYIWQNVTIISSGYEIERLKQTLTELETHNSLLTMEAASMEDLLVMESRAACELGMIRPSLGQVVYVRQAGNPTADDESQDRPAQPGR